MPYVPHPTPEGVAPSPDWTVTLGGEPAFVYHTPVGSVVLATADEPLDVVATPAYPFERVAVRPLSRGIAAGTEDGAIRFTAPATTPERPTLLSVECDDQLRRPLFVLISPPDPDAPRPGDPGVLYLEGGRVHDLGRVELKSGQTLYVAAGAVFRGHIAAHDAENVAVRGPGVLDVRGHTHQSAPPSPSGPPTGYNRERILHFAGCRNVRIEGVTLLDGGTWQVVPAGCDGVVIRDIKIVSGNNSDDGIDLVGSRDVLVEGCFVRVKDDCVAIKGVPEFHERAALPVHDITVRRCVFWNAEWGNALEIGYETRVDSMRRITFADCDIIRCEAERFGSGGVLTIHNGDRAVISDVLYEDLRIEDACEKLVDFKIAHDRYSKDDTRGQLQNVTLRNVRTVGRWGDSAGHPPVSILQGLNGRDHQPGPITWEDVVLHGEPVRDPGSARLVTEKIGEVRFVVGGQEFPLKK